MDKKNLLSELSDEQLNELYKYVPSYDEENYNNIRDKFYKNAVNKKTVKIKKRSVLVASILAVIILFSGFVYAGVIDLIEIYEKAFGKNGGYINKYGEELNFETENEGIKLKLLSAFRDEDNLTVFYTLQDLKGDRLSDSSICNFVDLSSKYGIGSQFSTVLEYDKNTKTATFMYRAKIDNLIKDSMGRLSIYSIFKEYASGIEINKDLNIYSELNKHKYNTVKLKDVKLKSTVLYYDNNKITNDSLILKPDELSIPLLSNKFLISNVGIVDGNLHIQITNPDDSVDSVFRVSFVDSMGYEKYENSYRINYGEGVTKGEHQSSKYIEYVFENINDISQVKDLRIKMHFSNYGEFYKGVWNAEYELPKKTPITTIYKKEYKDPVEKLEFCEIKLSPIRLTVKSVIPQNKEKPFEGIDLDKEQKPYVKYKNGKKQYFNESGYSTITHGLLKYNDLISSEYYGAIVDLDEVKSVTINGQEFKVE